jgi:hypothetical protein
MRFIRGILGHVHEDSGSKKRLRMFSVVEIMLSFQEEICDVYFADSLNYAVNIERNYDK